MNPLIHRTLGIAALAVVSLIAVPDAAARNVHGTTRTSIGYGGGNSVSRSAAMNGPGNSASVSRSTSVSGGYGSASVNRNTNVNRSTVNGNTNINVNRNVDIDVDNHWDNGWSNHPVAAGVAVGTAAAVTAAAIGSIAYSVPPSCVPVVVNGVTFQQCGSTWYQPRYAGSSVQYVVVTAPR